MCMYVRLCVCVCVYVCMCVCMYVHTCVCMYVHTCVCMYVCTYVCSLGMHTHRTPGRPGDCIFTMAPNIWNVICACSSLHTKCVSIHVHEAEERETTADLWVFSMVLASFQPRICRWLLDSWKIGGFLGQPTSKYLRVLNCHGMEVITRSASDNYSHDAFCRTFLLKS